MDLVKEIDKIIEELDRKKKHISTIKEAKFSDLFTPQFMSKNTDYPTISEFVGASGLDFQQNWAETVDKAALDKFVSANSRFSNWQEMVDVAAKEYIDREIEKA